MKKYRAFGRDFNINEIGILFIFMGFIVCLIGIALIADILTPPPQAHPIPTINVYGFQIWAFLPSLMLLCIAVAWVIHGFGFIIVRVG